MSIFSWLKSKLFLIMASMLGIALVTIEFMSRRRKWEAMARAEKKAEVREEGFKAIIEESDKIAEKKKGVDVKRRDYFE